MVIRREKKLKLSNKDFYIGMFRHIMYISYLWQNIKTDSSEWEFSYELPLALVFQIMDLVFKAKKIILNNIPMYVHM